MSEDQNLVPVRKAEIEMGKPLPFAVFDSDRNLLLKQGDVVSSKHQIDILLRHGMFRDRSNPESPAAGEVEDESKSGVGKPMGEKLSFDAIKLMPGDALQMQPLQEGQIESFTVHVIGVVKPKSLLVTAPELDEGLIFVRDAQTYLVRAFSGLNACAFKTRILRSQLLPFPYLHLSYPASVHSMRIRKAMRAPANIIVALHESEGGPQISPGKIIDISVGGARVYSTATLGNKDQTLWLSFKVMLGDMEEYVKTPAVIRTVGEEDDEQGKRMHVFGLQFGELAQSQRLIIMNLVYQHLLKESA